MQHKHAFLRIRQSRRHESTVSSTFESIPANASFQQDNHIGAFVRQDNHIGAFVEIKLLPMMMPLLLVDNIIKMRSKEFIKAAAASSWFC
jgi:hypothetical protein